jgi:hypothetical protein
MPPRFAYWTILVDGKATAFRAHDREELLPTLNQLRRKNADVSLRYFARGKLWDSPEQSRWADKNLGGSGEKRGRDWRPGGAHKDPRARKPDARGAGHDDRSARNQSDRPARPRDYRGARPRDDRGPRTGDQKRPWQPKPNDRPRERPIAPREARSSFGKPPRDEKRPWTPKDNRPPLPWNADLWCGFLSKPRTDRPR